MMTERDKILMLPHAHHPRLTRAVHYLASVPGMTADRAVVVLDEVRLEQGVTDLDIEMAHPASVSSVPFAPSRANAGSDYDENVRLRVHARIAANKEHR